jgi:hypothetical protein
VDCRELKSLLLISYTVDRQLRHSTDHVLTAEQLHSRQTATTLDRSRPYCYGVSGPSGVTHAISLGVRIVSGFPPGDPDNDRITGWVGREGYNCP